MKQLEFRFAHNESYRELISLNQLAEILRTTIGAPEQQSIDITRWTFNEMTNPDKRMAIAVLPHLVRRFSEEVQNGQ